MHSVQYPNRANPQAASIYEDMFANIVRQVSLSNISRFKTASGHTETMEDAVKNYQIDSTKDIYGQGKTKLKQSEASRYFECGNCGRKIAGGRFAQHINKCLERDRR